MKKEAVAVLAVQLNAERGGAAHGRGETGDALGGLGGRVVEAAEGAGACFAWVDASRILRIHVCVSVELDVM